MSAALDGEASEVEVKSIRNHLARCQPTFSCRRGEARHGAPACSHGAEGSQKHELRLSPAELTLIYKSLEAAKTLRVVPPQDELLEDTMQLVDQALRNA